MKIEAEVKLNMGKITSAVYKALIPDNVGVPECMNLSMSIEQGIIDVTINSSCSIDTFISTIDDVLQSCELSLRSLSCLSDGD
ncbi:MAG: KEOPS complex subunit Pcc1 [Conexivisphaerales archaeon]